MAASRNYSEFESFHQTQTSTTDNSSSLNLLALSDYNNTPGSARHRQPANDELLEILDLEKNNPMGSTPEWMPPKMRNPDPQFQCASTASNIYREAMYASHVIDSNDSPKYRDLMQVQVPKWIEAMEQAGLAEEIPEAQVRPGDVVVGLGGIAGKPQNNDRHIGFVGEYDEQTHKFSAYSNALGTLTVQDLDDRFGQYREEHFYRIYFPE